MASDNPFSYGSSSWTKLGKDTGFSNPLGETSWKMDGNWGSGFDVDTAGKFGSGPSPFGSKSGGSGWTKGAEFLGGFLSKMGQDKYRTKAEDFGPRPLGYPSFGSGGQVLENLGVVFPQQAAPYYIPGSEGSGKSTGQRIAGGLGGALSGAATGAAFGPIGIAAGALLGGASGAFG